MSKKGKKKEVPSISSSAGLIRFFEESDVKIALKPHLIILFAIVFVAVVIVLSKVVPVA
ncbi:MAG: preprotein translocase subunit Sec61beta [Desulfurococcaceae archaeon]